MAYRFYKITHNADGSERAGVTVYEDVTEAEGNFEFEKGLAMESGTFAFLMLLDGDGQIHNGYKTIIGEGTIKPRLFEVKTTTEEAAKSYIHDTGEQVSADFYKRLGGAKKTDTVKATMLRGIGANGEPLEYAYWVRPIEPII